MLTQLALPFCCCTRVEYDLTTAACVMFVIPRIWSLIVLYSFLLCVLALLLSVVVVVAAFAIPVGSSFLSLLVVVVPYFDVVVCFHICVCCTVWAFFSSSILH